METLEETLKPLALTFTREGFDYQQIWRHKDVAVYQYGVPQRFELVITRIRDDETLPSGSKLPLAGKPTQRRASGDNTAGRSDQKTASWQSISLDKLSICP